MIFFKKIKIIKKYFILIKNDFYILKNHLFYRWKMLFSPKKMTFLNKKRVIFMIKMYFKNTFFSKKDNIEKLKKSKNALSGSRTQNPSTRSAQEWILFHSSTMPLYFYSPNLIYKPARTNFCRYKIP
jgi:hypothetical protein